MPLCSPFPGNLSVLVLDNARIHHGAEILELAEHFRVFSCPSSFIVTDVDFSRDQS